MHEILFIAILLAALAYWWDTTVTNELALRACQHICQRTRTQLLDGTVMRHRVWLRRSTSGWLQICRLYSFEYSEHDDSRQQGYLVTLGHQVVETNMGSEQTRH